MTNHVIIFFPKFDHEDISVFKQADILEPSTSTASCPCTSIGGSSSENYNLLLRYLITCNSLDQRREKSVSNYACSETLLPKVFCNSIGWVKTQL